MPSQRPGAYRIQTRKTWFENEDDLAREMRLWGVTEYSASKVGSSGARIRWFHPGVPDPVMLESTDQINAPDNLRKLMLIVQGLRQLEARGFKEQTASFYAQTTSLAVLEEVRAGGMDPYTVLGVRPDAEWEVVEGAWKAAMRRWHPDREPDKALAERKAKELNAAFEELKERRGGR